MNITSNKRRGDPMKILMFGPGRKVKGGISTVVNLYFSDWDFEGFPMKYISTMEDGRKIKKTFVFFLAMVKAVFIMPFYDLIHLHMASNNSFNRKRYLYMLAKVYNKKVVIHLHGAEFMQFYQFSKPTKQKQIREVFDGAHGIIALSEQWKTNIQTFTDTPIQVIYNAVPLPRSVQPKKNKNICFLGRIGERKGVFDLLEVIQRLNMEYQDYEVFIGGDGDIERMNTYIQAHKLRNVHYVGWIGGEKKEALLRDCAIFALPSSNEGLPMAMLEAMSYGCSPISTYVGGIPEVIDHEKNGFLMQAKDQEKLYTILKNIMNNGYDLPKMSKRARLSIENKYSLPNSIKKLYAFYQH